MYIDIKNSENFLRLSIFPVFRQGTIYFYRFTEYTIELNLKCMAIWTKYMYYKWEMVRKCFEENLIFYKYSPGNLIDVRIYGERFDLKVLMKSISKMLSIVHDVLDGRAHRYSANKIFLSVSLSFILSVQNKEKCLVNGWQLKCALTVVLKRSINF